MKFLFRVFLWLFVLPSIVGSLWSVRNGWPDSFRTANWDSARVAPNPAKTRDAIIQVYSARAGRWKGAFGVHTWIVMKERGASRFERYDVVGWGRPVRRNNYPVDGHWYSNAPSIIRDIRGPLATEMIPNIRKTIARYPDGQRGDYLVWPGPNSNSFIAWIARQFPELAIEMPATAVGKDFLGTGFRFGPTPSGTGWQFNYGGFGGAGISWKEGLEFHILGGTIGIDPQELAIKLPSVGKLALLPNTK